MTLLDDVWAIPPQDLTRAWGRNCERLRAHMLHRDWAHFLRWGVVEETISASGAYIDKELAMLKALPDWPRWERAIIETERGDPKPWAAHPATSGNMIHQACHIATWENVTGKRVLDLRGVFEFGGGYGCMARLFRNLGFKGEYQIYDLPIMGALQDYYLDGLHIWTTDDMNDMYRFACPDLFISMWALSETPMGVRDEVAPRAVRFANVLIAYQFGFEEVVNGEYFEGWQKEGKWVTLPMEHMPPTSHYLIGER